MIIMHPPLCFFIQWNLDTPHPFSPLATKMSRMTMGSTRPLQERARRSSSGGMINVTITHHHLTSVSTPTSPVLLSTAAAVDAEVGWRSTTHDCVWMGEESSGYWWRGHAHIPRNTCWVWHTFYATALSGQAHSISSNSWWIWHCSIQDNFQGTAASGTNHHSHNGPLKNFGWRSC